MYSFKSEPNTERSRTNTMCGNSPMPAYSYANSYRHAFIMACLFIFSALLCSVLGIVILIDLVVTVIILSLLSIIIKGKKQTVTEH